ncbi:Etoposide-induced protein 2.4-like protein [Hypsibius exemplaris]|uniref:Etoposide-induced protein 2.4-like protein n=1 Tax=Hypsibius exemplaris TaxID=2072580 RepID=A0A1W0WRS5_HYPEX|nr:Etoposide-induced protein 2.4-like protein [Hypsibius exemplaris]
MSSRDLQSLATSFIHGFRDAILGFVYFYKLNRDTDVPVSVENERSTTVTELQRRREERLPRRPTKKSERPKIRKRILQCCLLNGGVFLASIFIFDHLVIPVLSYVTHMMLGHEEGVRASVWLWLSVLASGLFKILWILPLFIISRVVSFIWFQDIADAAYSRFHPKATQSSSPGMSFGTLIADLCFGLLIQGLFLLQAQVAAVLPIPAIAQILSVFHMSLSNAVYAFEYKWFNIGWEVNKRLHYVEARWSYFLGFGLPLALATSWAESYWINGCIFAVLFPLLIVSANEATPSAQEAPFELPVFALVVRLSNFFFSHGVSRSQQTAKKQPQSSSSTDWAGDLTARSEMPRLVPS